MTKPGYTLIGLTAIIGAFAGALVFTILRAMAAAREMAFGKKGERQEAAFMTTALEQALADLRTRERAMTARAEASEKLSDEIIASLTSGLLMVGVDRRVRTLNPAGRRLLGLSEATRFEDLEDMLRETPPLATLIIACLDNGEPIRRCIVRLAAAGGRETHLGVTVSPLAEASVGARGVICLFSDLTDIVALEEQLRLKGGLAEVGELTAGIAHEFRNGLATIHGYARLLDLDRLPPEMRTCVSGIREETDTLGAIVRNFLNFARPTELILATIDPSALVERVADEMRGDARARGGDVVVRGSFVPVLGDEILLRQVFSNLCRNALEACLDADVVPHVAIEGEPTPAQRVLRISVIDNGPGIEPAVASTLFRPFVTTRKHGTGLGLAIVQKIVVTHNGRVTVQPEQPAGSRFTVALPLA